MKTLTFNVTLQFESNINDDNDIEQVAENVARAIILETNGQGISPQNGDTYLEKVNVTYQFLPELNITKSINE